MREAIAAVFDALMSALFGYLALRVAEATAPCSGNLANCFALTPMVIVLVIAAIGAYFGVPYLLFGKTLGQLFLTSTGSRRG